MEVGQGEVAVAQRPAVLTTILGSCVAVTFWSPRTGLGAMCHGVLPEPGRHRGKAPALRFVEPAILEMIAKFAKVGVSREEIAVKIFGGGEVMDRSQKTAAVSRSVGTQNVEKAFEVLEREGFEISAWDVGGKRGRRILFDTATGEVLLRRLPRTASGVSEVRSSKKQPRAEKRP